MPKSAEEFENKAQSQMPKQKKSGLVERTSLETIKGGEGGIEVK